MTVTPRDMKARLRNERLALRDAMPVEARIEASLAMADHAGERLSVPAGEAARAADRAVHLDHVL